MKNIIYALLINVLYKVFIMFNIMMKMKYNVMVIVMVYGLFKIYLKENKFKYVDTMNMNVHHKLYKEVNHLNS